jgi:hypothetical protein
MFPHKVVVCDCSHLKREHVITKRFPNGPCTACACAAFTPEPQCGTPKCGHGKKAHRSGRCHECGCAQFRPKHEGGRTAQKGG